MSGQTNEPVIEEDVRALAEKYLTQQGWSREEHRSGNVWWRDYEISYWSLPVYEALDLEARRQAKKQVSR